LSLVGGAAGIATGVGGAKLLSFLVSSLPTRVSFWSILLAVAASVTVGVFFGVYPARRAAHLDPIAALRHE